ncbi:MAG: hypothetical protein ACI8RZ_000781 [Myxococcota bacterium]|jgi:hypothetical protein
MSSPRLDPADPVSDDEVLYRRIFPNPSENPTRFYEVKDDGSIELNPSAFDDNGLEPSVNRAEIWPDPRMSQGKPSEGMLALCAGNIRWSCARRGFSHELGVAPAPIPPRPPHTNPAHALIFVHPMPNKKTFKRKVRLQLVRIAEESGVWCIPPMGAR